MISLRHLAIFKAICETGSFTRAAQRLYITQSAVSHAISELETRAGCCLFDRLNKKAVLTAGGRLLLEEALPLLSAFETLEGRLSDLSAQAPIRLVSSITIASFYLPPALARFRAKAGAQSFQVQVMSAARAMETLLQGGADLALVEGARPQGPLAVRKFSEYRMKAVCAPGHIPGGGRLSLEEFLKCDLLLREKGSAIRDTLDSQLLLLGHAPRPVWESVNSTALLEAAKAGLGIAVLPEALVSHPLAQGVLAELEIEGLNLKNDMLMVHHQDKRLFPGLRAFMDFIGS